MTDFLAGYALPPGAGVDGDPGLKASRHSTGGALGVFETTIEAGPPLHVHDREDECFYVLDGELSSIFPWLARIDVTLEPHEVNGQPGAIFRDRDSKVLLTVALDVLDGQIQTIRSVSNPDELGHVGPVADAWAVAREVNQARRR